MLVSIVICTCNRAESLQLTLQSMVNLHIPPGMQVELLVVDNGSSDTTQQVVLETHFRNIALRYVREDRRGQCYARNRGLHETAGEIILFTDDDVRPPQDWIVAMCEPILQDHADAVLGGISVPDHLQRPWFDEFPDSWLVARTVYNGRRHLREDEALIGASMAFSRRVLDKVAGFDIELDPGALGFAGDTLFTEQLRVAGYRLFANFDVRVDHHFDADRLTEASVVNQARAMGRSAAYLSYHFMHSNVRLTWLKLQYMRLKKAMCEVWTYTWRKTQDTGPAAWRVRCANRIGYYEQYCLERKRPRNYERRGLKKINGRQYCSSLAGAT